MHPTTLEVAHSSYDAVKEKAESRGFVSVEDYVADWLENDAASDLPMSPELVLALESGLADSRAGRVISLEEHRSRHAERRATWIQAHPT